MSKDFTSPESRRNTALLSGLFRISVFALVCATLFSCDAGRSWNIVSGPAQGNSYCIKYRGANLDRDEAQFLADSLFRRIDSRFSIYNPSSLVSRLNRGEISLEQALCDSLFSTLYNLSLEVKHKTGGAVDVTAGALFRKMGFGDTEGGNVDGNAAGISDGDVDGNAGGNVDGDVPSPAVCLNFNAVAQGFSCDFVAKEFLSRGATDIMVDLSGEAFTAGLNPSGRNWTFGIDAPFDGNDTPGAKLSTTFSVPSCPCGVVTSGNYRKFYYKDGRKVSHTIDPRTGESVENSLLSATVVVSAAAFTAAAGVDADSTVYAIPFDEYPSFFADAFATYCMVVGVEQASNFILSTPGVEGCLIYSSPADSIAIACPDALQGSESCGAPADSMLIWRSPGFGK